MTSGAELTDKQWLTRTSRDASSPEKLSCHEWWRMAWNAIQGGSSSWNHGTTTQRACPNLTEPVKDTTIYLLIIHCMFCFFSPKGNWESQMYTITDNRTVWIWASTMRTENVFDEEKDAILRTARSSTVFERRMSLYTSVSNSVV